jgi:hypothetical protein
MAALGPATSQRDPMFNRVWAADLLGEEWLSKIEDRANEELSAQDGLQRESRHRQTCRIHSGRWRAQGRRRGCRTSGTLDLNVRESEKEAPKWDVRGGQAGGQARTIASQLGGQ